MTAYGYKSSESVRVCPDCFKVLDSEKSPFQQLPQDIHLYIGQFLDVPSIIHYSTYASF